MKKNNNYLFLGLSLQLGFSVRNKVNLLASAYTSPEEGYGGTGIYLRDGTSNVIINSEGFLSKDVPIDSKSSNVIDVSTHSHTVHTIYFILLSIIFLLIYKNYFFMY